VAVKSWLKRSALLFLPLSLLSGCSPYHSSPGPQVKPLSEDEEVRISREFRREAKKILKLVRHPEIERYVDGVGRRLLSAIGPQPFDYRFFIVENSQLNAFAVPGGTIYIHTGLLERIGSTDDLAGVLGHEIIHIKSRHAARLSGPDPINLLALLGVFLGAGGPGAQAAGVVAQALAVTRMLSYSRQMEQEADTLGVKLMVEAGYDPRAALNFFKIVERERLLNPVDLPPYLMTHPLTQERIARVEGAIRSFSPSRSASDYPDPVKRIQTILRLQRDGAEDATTEQERLLSQEPQKAGLLHLLSLAYHAKGKWPQAREGYEKTRALDPKSPGIDRDLGRLYTQIGEFALAHAALERSLSAEPREALNYLSLGELLEKESNFQAAAGAYLQAHSLAPLWAEPPQRLGIVYGKMKRLGDAYYYLGRSQLLQDEDEKAIADLERALKTFDATSPRGQMIREEIEAIKARLR